MLYFRLALPHGFPKEYRFAVTFRLHRNVSSKKWNLIQISDNQNSLQFYIALNSAKSTIEFSTITEYQESDILSWYVPSIFDHGWHKIRFGIFENLLLESDPSEDRSNVHKTIVLYLDCSLVGKKTLKYMWPKGCCNKIIVHLLFCFCWKFFIILSTKLILEKLHPRVCCSWSSRTSQPSLAL